MKQAGQTLNINAVHIAAFITPFHPKIIFSGGIFSSALFSSLLVCP
jgi:hypothetical protein